MDILSESLAQLTSSWAGSLFPLIAAAVFLLVVVSVAMSVILNARGNADSRVAELVRALADARAKLIEAEKTGRFGTFLWDFTNPSVSFWSDEMFNLFGSVPRKKPPAAESVGSMMYEKDRESGRVEWERACTQPGDFNIRFRTLSPSGQIRFVEMRGRTVFGIDHRPKNIQGVAHDITREMEIDRAKSEFVSLASHQLKTPLTSIKWLSESLLSAKADPLTPTQAQYAHNIHDASLNMIEMVNDLLNVSRIELGTLSVRLEQFDACEFVKSVADDQRHVADQKHVEVKLLCGAEIPQLMADKGLMRMVVQNLLSNAIKYTPENGVVECELSLTHTKRDMLFMRVSDTGIGIPKNEKENVFKKLYRASNAEKLVPDGTGLGLYVIKQVVEHAGGGITFESTEGKGTTFYVSIPITWPQSKAGHAV
jgi:signal transduction histidine kinase